MTDARSFLSDRLTAWSMVSGSATLVGMDALAEVLRVTRVRGAVMAQVVAGDPWGLDVADSGAATVHAVTAGTAWLRVPGHEPARPLPGHAQPRGTGDIVM